MSVYDENHRDAARKSVRESIEHRKTEKKLARLADMPDLLDQYDALCERMTRMLVFIEFIDSENRKHWDKVPKRVERAFRILYKEMRMAEREIEQHDSEQRAR